jgi:carbon-monoxide dehydrogenase medium subunit
MQEFDFIQPYTLTELLDSLQESGGKVIAGGTDVLPKMKQGLFSSAVLVDASRITELSFIRESDDQISIGALTTHQELVASPVLQSANPALVSAAESIGCIQTRQRGTLGGNLVNASPAGDTILPLLAFEAQVRLDRVGAQRILPLDEFFVAPGKTTLEPGELLHSISFPRLTGAWGAAFQKLGKRKGMAIAVVSVAAAVVLDAGGLVQAARIALGSVSPTVVRSPGAESSLIGTDAGSGAIQGAADSVGEDISPISDVRSTADYRRHAAQVLTRRALEEAIEQAKGRLS